MNFGYSENNMFVSRMEDMHRPGTVMVLNTG